MQDWVIRSARLADAPHIEFVQRKAVLESGTRHYERTEVEAWAAPRGRGVYERGILQHAFLVAITGGRELLGFGEADLAAARVHALYVHPSQQRRGVGAALLAELERNARSLGIRQLNVHASLCTESFFARNGYRVLGRRPHDVARRVWLSFVHMGKQL